MSLLTHDSFTAPELHKSGERVTEQAPGSLYCVSCGYAISIAALDALPTCPACHGARFRRASIFDQPTMDADAVEVAEPAPAWLEDIRAAVESPGRYLAFEDAGAEPTVIRLELGWTRIGRSGVADVRLDDPTVSRRHTLVVLTEDDELRALDDRSLNGLFVNGEAVEWATLSDGDELEIGRYRLYVIEA